MKNKVRVSKNKRKCSRGFKVRVEVPGEEFFTKITYEPTNKNHKLLVNELRHASKVYVKINGTRMRGMYDEICRQVGKDKYFLIKEKIYSEICNKYPYLTYTVYKQRQDLQDRAG